MTTDGYKADLITAPEVYGETGKSARIMAVSSESTPPESTSPDGVPPDSLPLLLSPTRVASELSMSKQFVYREIREGRIPAIRFGRKVRVHRDTVLKMAAGEDVSGSGSSKQGEK